MNDLTKLIPGIPTDRCLRVAISQWPPYVKGQLPGVSGSAVQIFKVIQEKLGFCYQFMKPPDGLWGAPLPNGSWFGMMGMLQREEVDMAVGPFGVTLDRSSVADFSVPILSTDHTILYLRPKIQPDLLGFTKPFSLPVWAMVASSLLLTTGMALLLRGLTPAKTEKKRDDENHDEDGEGTGNNDDKSERVDNGTLLHQYSWMWGYMALIGQAMYLRKGGSEAERLLVLLWLLVALIIDHVYKGNLKAMLIVPKVKIPFDSLEGLVAQKEMSWTFPRGSIVHSSFEAANHEDSASTMGKGWTDRGQLLIKPREMLPSILSGIAGLFTRDSSVYLMSEDFSQTGVCQMAVTRGGFLSVQYSMAFPRGSKLKPVFDDLLYRLKEFGLLGKYLGAEMGNATQCLHPPGYKTGTELRELATGDFLGVFSVFAAGIAMSTAVFMLEMMIGRATRAKVDSSYEEHY